MIGKSIKSVANKFLNKLLQPKDETVVEVKTDVWRSMYPFFCDQALSASDVAIESLKILDVLIDYGIVGDYKNLQKVLLHKSDEVAHLALDVLRKIKGLTIGTRIEGVKPVSAESSAESIEKVPQKIDQQIKETEHLMQKDEDLQNRIFNVLKKEDSIAEKVSDIEEKVEDLCQKTQEVPSNLTQDYDNKFKALEDGIEELKKLFNSNIANENVLVEKAAEQVLERVKPSGHISKSEISSISQFTQKPARDSQYSEGQGANLLILDNTPETSIILLNWVKFLMEKVGRNNLADILEYYVEIGWISDEVSSMMADYANGIDYYVEKSTWNLPEVHTKSLLFIEQLRRCKKDKKLFSLLKYRQGSTIPAHGLQ